MVRHPRHQPAANSSDLPLTQLPEPPLSSSTDHSPPPVRLQTPLDLSHFGIAGGPLSPRSPLGIGRYPGCSYDGNRSQEQQLRDARSGDARSNRDYFSRAGQPSMGTRTSGKGSNPKRRSSPAASSTAPTNASPLPRGPVVGSDGVTPLGTVGYDERGRRHVEWGDPGGSVWELEEDAPDEEDQPSNAAGAQ